MFIGLLMLYLIAKRFLHLQPTMVYAKMRFTLENGLFGKLPDIYTTTLTLCIPLRTLAICIQIRASVSFCNLYWMNTPDDVQQMSEVLGEAMIWWLHKLRREMTFKVKNLPCDSSGYKGSSNKKLINSISVYTKVWIHGPLLHLNRVQRLRHGLKYCLVNLVLYQKNTAFLNVFALRNRIWSQLRGTKVVNTTWVVRQF